MFTDNSCWPGQSDNLPLLIQNTSENSCWPGQSDTLRYVYLTVTMITSCAYNTIQFGGVHLDNSD